MSAPDSRAREEAALVGGGPESLLGEVVYKYLLD
jgi:hypothetical protein